MEPTNPTPPTSIVPPTPTSTLPSQDSIPPVNQQAQTIVQEKKGFPSLLMWIILGVVVLGSVGGGAYWWMMRSTPSETAMNTSLPAETASPAPQVDLNQELSQITVDDSVEEDFTALDKDLQSL